MKFNTHHFPNGTVFQLKSDNFLNAAGEQRTVRGIVRNGLDNYVLKTGIEKPAYEGGKPIEESFNIEHVERIISRGGGPVEIDHLYFGPRKNDARTLSDVHMMKFNNPYQEFDNQKGEWTFWKPRKGNHNTGSIQSLLIWEAGKIASEGAVIDYQKLIQIIMKQSWCQQPRFQNPFLHLHVINKKRLRKFLKANINRFLLKLAPAIRAEYEDRMEDYDRDWEDDIKDELKLSLNPEEEQGSHYSLEDDDFDRWEDARMEKLNYPSNPIDFA